jgi:hypothetical protein
MATEGTPQLGDIKINFLFWRPYINIVDVREKGK